MHPFTNRGRRLCACVTDMPIEAYDFERTQRI